MQRRQKPSEINGGRTRTRTWDPLIKSHQITIINQAHFDISSVRSGIEPERELENVETRIPTPTRPASSCADPRGGRSRRHVICRCNTANVSLHHTQKTKECRLCLSRHHCKQLIRRRMRRTPKPPIRSISKICVSIKASSKRRACGNYCAQSQGTNLNHHILYTLQEIRKDHS